MPDKATLDEVRSRLVYLRECYEGEDLEGLVKALKLVEWQLDEMEGKR